MSNRKTLIAAAIAGVVTALSTLPLPAAMAETLPQPAAKPSSPEPKGEAEPGVFSVTIENDIFADTDRHYTNGVRFAWLSGPDHMADWVLRAARLFPLFPQDGDLRAGYAFGQNMYTPSDITIRNPPTDDRPYAGWLYGSVEVIAETGDRLDRLGLTLGIVGPSSQAASTQKYVHEVIQSDDPKGWHTQLHDEPGIILTYQRSWRRFATEPLFANLQFDVTPHAGGALGNIFTYANAGVTVRVGGNLPLDYGPPRIQPSLPGSGFFKPADGFGWYLFAGFDGRIVARNIFLDGNTFRSSRSIEKKPFVGDFQFGVSLTWDDVRLSYTHVMRTPEFKGQQGTDGFGALSLSARF